ncbi:MAG: extracellular solute-binding protein [Anaerolineales bacterium]|nr:extracellular solute-binding protein [Anaerolineales bacterium]NUQ84436.1 extracellular solute-binding protein [Anaerolineales bacterium]
MKQKRLWAGLSTLILITGLLLSACQPTTVTVTVEVTKQVPVEVETIIEVTSTPVNYGNLVWLSTQLRPVQEAEKVRGVILADFPGTVEFIPEDEGPFHDRIAAEVQTGQGTVDVLGALHGNFSTMAPAGQLQDLTALRESLADRGIPDAFWNVAQLNTEQTYYVPWMQATYIIAANKAALEYLPSGADPNALTYEQYAQWAKNVFDATGEAKFGFPAGEQGLLHRFFQGFLVPSFSGGVVTTFAGADAAAGWQWLVDMWPYVHPQSTTYNFMQEPLLSEEVWVAWDHTARLKDAFEARPDDFVALPVPAGPKGRAFMPVIAGLAIPVTSNNVAGAEALIRYMTEPNTQINTLREVGFFPVVAVDYPGFVSPGVKLEGEAVTLQAASPDALPALLPQGLGGKGGDFNKVFRDTFTLIVLNGEDIQTVLAGQKPILQAIMDETGAPCWSPDPDSGGQACQVQ